MALALGGWLVASGLLGVVVGGRRARARQRAVLARIGHELRGPLGAIGLALSAGPHRGALAIELSRVTAALDDLDALAGGHPVRAGAPRTLEPVDLYRLAGESVRAAQPLAARHGVRLLAPRSTAHAPIVLADPARLAQAAGNLIANAVEHGGGVVEVRVRRTADAVRLEVADGGPGLGRPVAELVAGEGAGRRGHGLAVAAAVAAAHGGRLSAAPAAAGARLVLELPAGGPQTRSDAGGER